MIIPSIDLMGGRTVQLVGGERLEIDAGDPFPLLERFSVVGEVAVIDLDAAKGEGDNQALIRQLVRAAPCRVGGGIRDYETAVRWLDAGAARIILGTAARPDLLARLPRERVIAAIDARDGEVVVAGWRHATGRRVEDVIPQLRPHVGGFLVTLVEREGRMTGLPAERIAALAALAGDARLTIAGGVATDADVALADRLGADAQVGMALYRGVVTLAGCTAACLRTDRPDGLFPTVVCDEGGAALGLAYSSSVSLAEAISTRKGVYWSRSRGRLWRKGESSGAEQQLLRVDLDCDRDTLRFTVRQSGPGFCHTGARTCFGPARGLAALEQTLRQRAADPTPGSYAARLLADPALLTAKLVEEAGELAHAGAPDEAAREAADVLFFTLTKLIAAGASLAAVEAELDRRALRLTRRPGDAKPAAIPSLPPPIQPGAPS